MWVLDAVVTADMLADEASVFQQATIDASNGSRRVRPQSIGDPLKAGSIEPGDAEERDADQEEAEGREGAGGDEVAEGDAGEPRRAQDDEELPDGEEEGDAPRGLPCPGAPSTAERVAHELTHYPYRKWCEHCVRGRAVGPNAKKVPAAGRETSVPRAHMDYAYLQEEVVEIEDEFKTETTATMSLTILVMIETLCESVCGSTRYMRRACFPTPGCRERSLAI